MARGFIVSCFLSAVVGGCGGQSTLQPVEGRVTLDGQPLADARVYYLPTSADSPGPYSASTDADGRYALSGPDGDGAAPGEYFLIVRTVEAPVSGDESNPAPPPKEKEVVPQDYLSGTMKVIVPFEGTSEANFDMKSR